jgi:oxygen-dependent protoporphyrinogen oxidase
MGHVVRVLALKLLTAGVELRTGVRVAGLEPAPAGGWLVHAQDEVIPADQVILAVPGPRAADLLLAHLPPDDVGWLGTLEHASVAFVALALPDDALSRPLDGSGYLIPRSAGTTVTAVSWSSSKWAHLAGVGDGEDGTNLVRASVGRAGDGGAVLELGDADLLRSVLDDLGATMGVVGDPADVRISRWPASLPQYAPGHLDRVAALEAAVRRDTQGVHLAGAAYRGLGVPACIRQGREAGAGAKAGLADRMVR